MSKLSVNNVKHIKSGTYFKGDLKTNGFLLIKNENFDIQFLTNSMARNLNEMEVFNTNNPKKCACASTFDGNEQTGKVQDGRLIMHYNEQFVNNKYHTVTQKNKFEEDMNNLGTLLTDELQGLVPDKTINNRFTFNAIKVLNTYLIKRDLKLFTLTTTSKAHKMMEHIFVSSPPLTVRYA